MLCLHIFTILCHVHILCGNIFLLVFSADLFMYVNVATTLPLQTL